MVARLKWFWEKSNIKQTCMWRKSSNVDERYLSEQTSVNLLQQTMHQSSIDVKKSSILGRIDLI